MADAQRPPAAGDHSSVEELISALRADGVSDSAGEFTLDRETARAKIRQFQLADPTRYVLSLIHAAVLKDATRVDVQVEEDFLSMTFDGRPFTLEDIEDLYGTLFVRAVGPDVEACREVAMAITAASALNTKRFSLCSGDGRTAVRYTLDDDGQEQYGAETKVVNGTSILVRTRFGGRFIRSLGLADDHPLEHQLRRCCRYSFLPIFVNDQQVSRGLHLPEALGTVTFETPNFRGVAGFLPEDERPGALHLCKYGVWFTSLELPFARPGYRAVVEGYHLRKDLSQAQAVRDAALDEVWQAVARAEQPAMDQLCRETVSRYLHQSFPRRWARGVLRAELLRHAAAGPVLGDGVAPRVQDLTRVPLWRVLATDGQDTGRLSLVDLVARRDAGFFIGLVELLKSGKERDIQHVERLSGAGGLVLISVQDSAEQELLRQLLSSPAL